MKEALREEFFNGRVRLTEEDFILFARKIVAELDRTDNKTSKDNLAALYCEVSHYFTEVFEKPLTLSLSSIPECR